MSNNVKRSHVKQPVGSLPLRVRASRHEKPLTQVYVVRSRTVETNKKTGLLVVKLHERPMTTDEIQAEREKVKRALGRTQSYGRENKPDNMAPRGKRGSKPQPGGKR